MQKTYKTQLLLWILELVFILLIFLPLLGYRTIRMNDLLLINFLGVIIIILFSFFGQYKIIFTESSLIIVYGLMRKKEYKFSDISRVYKRLKGTGIIISTVVIVVLKNGKEIYFNKNMFTKKNFAELEESLRKIVINN